MTQPPTDHTTDHHELRDKPIRNAFVVGCALGIFQQLAAINTIMYYGAVVMEMAGFPSSASIELTAVLALAQGIGVLISLYLYSILPRRTVLLWSIAGVVLGLALIGVAFEDVENMQVGFSDFVLGACEHDLPCAHSTPPPHTTRAPHNPDTPETQPAHIPRTTMHDPCTTHTQHHASPHHTIRNITCIGPGRICRHILPSLFRTRLLGRPDHCCQ